MAATTSGTIASLLVHSFKSPFRLSNATRSACSSSSSCLYLAPSRSSTASYDNARPGHGFHSSALLRSRKQQDSHSHLTSAHFPKDSSLHYTTRPHLLASTSTMPSHCRSFGSSSVRNNGNSHSGNGPSLRGTFVTGSGFDAPERPNRLASGMISPSSSTSATNPSPVTKLNGAITARIWDTLDDEIGGGSGAEDQENSQSTIQTNLKKLEAISKVTRRKQAYSPYLKISQLPPTVMPDDIRRMAVSEGSITDIIYHRNQFMEFQNMATVVFRSATDAVEFIAQKYGKFLGGHKLQMNMLDPYSPRDRRFIPPQLPVEPLSGQMVLVSGLPAASRPDNLRTEFRRFNLMDTTEAAIIPVPSKRLSSSCQYLIRLSSRSEAFRFVRTYHNTYFQFKEFRKRCPIRATVIY